MDFENLAGYAVLDPEIYEKFYRVDSKDIVELMDKMTKSLPDESVTIATLGEATGKFAMDSFSCICTLLRWRVASKLEFVRLASCINYNSIVKANPVAIFNFNKDIRSIRDVFDEKMESRKVTEETIHIVIGIAKSRLKQLVEQYCNGMNSVLLVPEFYTELYKELGHEYAVLGAEIMGTPEEYRWNYSALTNRRFERLSIIRNKGYDKFIENKEIELVSRYGVPIELSKLYQGGLFDKERVRKCLSDFKFLRDQLKVAGDQRFYDELNTLYDSLRAPD